MYPQRRRAVRRHATVQNLNDAWNTTADALSQLQKAHQFFMYAYDYDTIRQNSVLSQAEDALEDAVFAASAALEGLERAERNA